MTIKREIQALSDMEYDEVSLVGLACNQEADVVLFKSATKPSALTTVTRRSNVGKAALARFAIVKGNPTASDVHEDAPMGDKKKKRKKKLGDGNGDPMIEVSTPT